MADRNLSEWQQFALRLVEKGSGLDASPSAMTAKQRRECDELVTAGLLAKSKNHSKDRHGMYIKPSDTDGVKGDSK